MPASDRSKPSRPPALDVTITLSLAAPALAGSDVQQLMRTLNAIQVELARQGADIGRTLVTISDPASGEPLHASADDAWWSYRSLWYWPLVSAHARDPLSTLAGPLTGPLGPHVAQATSALPSVPGG
jgi:hypothetical protein